MSKISEDKREVLASIDAILTMIEKYPSLSADGLAENITVSPFDFLLSIIGKKTKDSEMIEWLVNILTKSLPTIELGVKGALLANLKRVIDCNCDPRIPEWIRMNPSNPTDPDRGFYINLRGIDYNNILLNSPVSKYGQNKYFGTRRYYTIDDDDSKYYTYKEAATKLDSEKQDALNNGEAFSKTTDNIHKHSEIDSVYELARAKDFNAFLWFVKNKARFNRIKSVSGNCSTYSYDGKNPLQGETVLGLVEGSYQSSTATAPFSVGDVLSQKYNGISVKTVAICLKETITRDDGVVIDSSKSITEQSVQDIAAPKTYSWKFVPVSPTTNGANWYVNSGTYFDFLKPKKNREERDFTKDIPLVNIQQQTKGDIANTGLKMALNNDYVKVQVMPAPFVHVPVVSGSVENGKLSYEGEPMFRFQRILFNENGEMDKNGHYTVTVTGKYTLNGNSAVYPISNNCKLTVHFDTGNYEISGSVDKRTCLVECYKGLTVYDFNYNFVMGMQLFDASVLASQLMEVGLGVMANASSQLGMSVSINKTESAYQMRVAEIVKNIIESTAYEASDCFYTFSNDKFNSMLEKAELKRAQGYNFNGGESSGVTVSLEDAYSILSEYSDDATLQENQDVITRAITQATASITDEILPSESYNIKMNLVQELIKSLVFVIVESILSPKIVLLFEINKRLMGDSVESLSIEDFIKSISGLITEIVTEIRDLILNELLDWALNILRELAEELASMLALEQVEYYSKLMKLLLKACAFKASHRAALDSKLDEVDYADIDEVDEPTTTEC